MSCECGCNSCGQTGLLGELLGATGGVLLAGSSIRIGFSITQTQDINVNDLIGCLYATGGFSFVDVEWIRNTWSINDYLLVTATTAIDFADKEDAGNLAAGYVGECMPYASISFRDPVAVDSIPQAGAGQAGVQQPVYTGSSNQPSQCDFSKLSFGDYLGCELGVTKTAGVAIGIAAALGLILLIRR